MKTLLTILLLLPFGLGAQDGVKKTLLIMGKDTAKLYYVNRTWIDKAAMTVTMDSIKAIIHGATMGTECLTFTRGAGKNQYYITNDKNR